MASAGPERLRRRVSRAGLTIYGIGGMLGGGIYALTGEVAGRAGSLAWASFVVAMVVAAPTAISYLVLATRLPRSAGEAHYVRDAFGSPTLAALVGWLVALSGLVSMAALSVAFAGYARALVPAVPTPAVIVAFLVGISAINLRGIRLTTGVNILFTAIEVFGLVIVIVVGSMLVFGGGAEPAAAAPASAPGAWGVMQGALLAFYAFIGFEDMVNIAEEVERPERAYRWAIPLALIVVSAVYVAIAALATQVVPIEVLAASDAPLSEVVERGLSFSSAELFNVIALFAVANSALLNAVMASRLLYGMGGEDLLPRWFAAVNDRYRTPHRSIAVVLALGLGLALTGSLAFLAGTTGLILLLVFATVNAALVVILGRGPGALAVPRAIPVLGVVLSLAMTVTARWTSAATAGAAIAVGAVLALVATRGLRRGRGRA
jgi:basic amino acid/polyamine antiporter, APA family